MNPLVEIRAKVEAKSKALHEIFEQAGPDFDFAKVTTLEGDTAAKIEKVRSMNLELEVLQKDLQKAQELEGIAEKVRQSALATGTIVHPASPGADGKPEQKSLGELFVEAKLHKNQEIFLPSVDMKTLMRTGAGWSPMVTRLPQAVMSPQRPAPVVVDFFPMLTTTQNSIKYMLESTFTNSAAEVAQATATTAADAYAESALALTETTDEVEKIATFLPVTEEQLEDVPGMQDYVNQRLLFMIRQRLDLQALAGDGSTPNLLGTLNVASINSQAKGTDPTPDAVYKAMTLVRSVGFTEPNVIFAHPNDWQDIRLLRTADGIYIYGNPSDPGPLQMWGVPVVQTTAATENTILLGDYANFSALFMRTGIELAVSDSHSFYFTRGILAVKATLRCAVVHFRAKAFAKVTGV